MKKILFEGILLDLTHLRLSVLKIVMTAGNLNTLSICLQDTTMWPSKSRKAVAMLPTVLKRLKTMALVGYLKKITCPFIKFN